MNQAKDQCTKLSTSSEMTNRIVDQITKTFSYKLYQIEHEAFLAVISPTLRFKVHMNLVEQMFDSSLFHLMKGGGMDKYNEILFDLTRCGEVFLYQPETIVIS